ncbi:MAG: poly-beta-1,6-N-acetyl-D-glucosamine biosynthesis protein PgaD [Planctomycetota bacterium]|jgi:poly-beta-1,6-N-acetyl-D-glucosamine biosynthesis protein PgaD|nr:poly-beta-1,6-N-acetyl-D-glucosamine biosynthesis protein PgaD [Planctomycetota bacterium]
MIISKEKLIITKNEKGINLRKTMSLVVFFAFWSAALYIMRPLIYIVGILIICFVFNKSVINMGIYNVGITFFNFYLPLIIVALSSLWTWAMYNRLRFGGQRDKRRRGRTPIPLLTPEMLGEYTGLGTAKINLMQGSKVVICHFDAKEELCDADCFISVDAAQAGQPSVLPVEQPVPDKIVAAHAKEIADARESQTAAAEPPMLVHDFALAEAAGIIPTAAVAATGISDPVEEVECAYLDSERIESAAAYQSLVNDITETPVREFTAWTENAPAENWSGLVADNQEEIIDAVECSLV